VYAKITDNTSQNVTTCRNTCEKKVLVLLLFEIWKKNKWNI